MNAAATDTAWPATPGWRRDDRNALAPAALLALLIVLMVVPEGFDYAALANPDAPAVGGPGSRLLWLLLMAGAGVLMLRRRALLGALISALNPFLLLFAALALASLAWSIDPTLSARRLYRLGAIIAVSLAFVLGGWQRQRLQAVLRPVLTVLLAGSFVFVLVDPALAVHQERAPELFGAWHGLANHKNSLGALACIALLLWAHAGLARQVRWTVVVPALALSLTCLLMARSSTSTLTAAFGVVFMALSLRGPQALRRHLPALVVALVATLLVYALGLLNLIPGSGLLTASLSAVSAKAGSFTGRTEIWNIITEHIRLRPRFGSGFAAYWVAVPTVADESYEFVVRMASFYPGSSHNGYLEVVNDLGVAGLSCLLLYIATHVRQALRLLRADPEQAVLLLALFFQQAISNLAESHWFDVLSVDFVFMTLASTALARALLEQRWRARLGEPAGPGAGA